MQEIALTLKTSLFSAPVASGWWSFAITFLICPLFIFLAPATGLFDEPEGDRKIHKRAKPLGGAALAVGFLPLYLVYGPSSLSLFFGLLIVFFAGIIDDLREVDPVIKLLLQAAAAVVVVSFSPLPPTKLGIGEGLSITLKGAANSGLVAFWLVGGTNGFNLIDGLDGLAAGVAFIALIPLALLGFGSPVFISIVTLLASLVAILIYNFHPARLFLGDGGSYFIGFLTSYLVIEGLSAASGSVGNEWSLAAGLLLLGLPVIDTALAIVRRLISRKGIMEADKNHVHHLLYRQYGQTRAVLIAYSLQAVLAGLAVLLIL